MPESMTAFIRHSEKYDVGEFIWELRSVNHRYLDCHIRLSEDLRACEPQVREQLRVLSRGRVECSLNFLPCADVGKINLNSALLKQLGTASFLIREQIQDVRPLSVYEVLRWPGVVATEQSLPEPLLAGLKDSLSHALAAFKQVREREGNALAELIGARNQSLLEQVEMLTPIIPDVLSQAREKIKAEFSELDVGHDPDRLEQELVYLAQKMDVCEELERLTTHANEIKRVLSQEKVMGRRLDFLMQELNREANTLASKAADQRITEVAVELKVLIEQMREQIQNLV